MIMEFNTWLIYISVIGLLIASPGPSSLLCMSDGLKFGTKNTIPTILGGASSALVLMSISAVGLGAILAASETLFFVIKLVGALYLMFLGWKSWSDGDLKIESPISGDNECKAVHYLWYRLYRKGFMVGISNPKDLLFFIALFPSFMRADLPQLEQYVVLACTWFVVECVCMLMYAGLGSKISPLLSTAKSMTIINRTVGSVFVCLGSALAVSASMNK